MKNRIIFVVIFLAFSYLAKAQEDTTGVSKLLNLSLEELMNINVITASGFMQTVSEAPSTITVITARQIAERGYEQLEDALRDVPGIDMIHINGYAPTLFYFRGMYGAENLRALLMIDGIAENNILGSNDLAGPAYSLHNIERIEIIWGPVSALYGANAFGGVINMITKKGQDINGIHAEQGFGSFNTSFEKFNLGLKKSKFEFALAGTLFSTDGPRFTNRDPNYSGSYVNKAYSLIGSVSYYAKKSVTTFGYRTYRTPMGWGTYSNSPTTYLRLPSQGYGNRGIVGVIQSNIRGGRSGLDDAFLRTTYIQNEWKPNEKFNILSRIFYRETGTADDSYIYVTANSTKLIWVPITSYSNRVAGSVSVNYSLSKRHQFSAGVEVDRDNVERGARKTTLDLNTPYLIDGVDTVTNIHATYLRRQYDIRTTVGSYFQYNLSTNIFGKTNFTFGGRFDYNSYWGNALSPRIAIVNQHGKNLTFKLQFGRAFRAPTNLEIYQITPNSNFHLKKEQITTYEVNAIYSPSPKVRLQLNGFRNELSDVIILTLLSSPLTPDKNPGAISINGIEGILNTDITRNITAFANVTYQYAWGKNLVTNKSGKVPGVANLKGNAGLAMHLDNFFIVSVSGNWVGTRPSPRTDPYGSVKGYFLTNLNVSTENLFNNKITVSLNIHNLFNVKWLDPGFRTADGFLYATVLEQPGSSGLIKIGVNL